MAEEEQPKALPDFPAKRVTWRGTTYDSQLEADWASTLTKWDMLFVYHPGRIFLADSVYEPDFQLEGDILLEVKGLHNDRIEKVYEAQEQGYKIVVGRPGVVMGDNEVEFAIAVWDGDYVVAFTEDERLVFQQDPGVEADGEFFFSAESAVLGFGPALQSFKAVGEDGIV